MVGKGAPEVRLVACILHEALNKSPDCKSYGLPTLSEYYILYLTWTCQTSASQYKRRRTDTSTVSGVSYYTPYDYLMSRSLPVPIYMEYIYIVD